jgi:hypothetical protein
MTTPSQTKERILRFPRTLTTMRAVRRFERNFSTSSVTDEMDSYRMRAIMDSHPAFGKWLSRKALGRGTGMSLLSGPTSSIADEGGVSDAVSGLDRDGYYVFPRRAPESFVSTVREFALSAPCQARGDDSAPGTYPRGNAAVGRYDFTETTMLECEEIQDFASDPVFAEIARLYLRQDVTQDLLALWWTAPAPHQDAALNAQMFHQDRDRLSFLKFFMYVTDVRDDTGPHVYLSGSHRTLDKRLRGDGRITDESIRETGDWSRVRRLVAPAGTILAVDTAGLHKGEVPLVNDRLVLQVQFSTSLFGAPFELPRFPASDLARARYEAMPRVLRRWASCPDITRG